MRSAKARLHLDHVHAFARRLEIILRSESATLPTIPVTSFATARVVAQESLSSAALSYIVYPSLDC